MQQILGRVSFVADALAPTFNYQAQMNALFPGPTAVDMTRKPAGTVIELRTPLKGLARARKVVTRSRSRSTGKYPSWKMRRMIQWESPHELNAYRLFDCDPAVVSFQEQPLEIRYEINGEVHRHYPDVLVQRNWGSELCEVKTHADAIRPEVAERTSLMTAELPRFGFRYRMMLAEDLGGQPGLVNALLILQYGRRAISIQERQLVLRFFNNHPEIQWGDVIAGLLGTRGRMYVCRLLLEGVLSLDISQPIRSETRIYPVGSAGNVSRALLTLGG